MQDAVLRLDKHKKALPTSLHTTTLASLYCIARVKSSISQRRSQRPLQAAGGRRQAAGGETPAGCLQELTISAGAEDGADWMGRQGYESRLEVVARNFCTLSSSEEVSLSLIASGVRRRVREGSWSRPMFIWRQMRLAMRTITST